MHNIWLFLHILSAIVAFGVLFTEPLIERSVTGAREAFANVGKFVQAPALLVLIVTGVAGAYTSRTPRRAVFDEAWISIGFAVWIAMAVVLFFLVKAQRTGSKSAPMLTGVMHLLLVVVLWAMIWKPGLGV